MLTLQDAFKILANLIRVGSPAYHRDYKRVCELADLNYKLITGDKAEELILQFVKREDAEGIEQRRSITQLTSKSWAGCIMQPFYRPGRMDNIKRTVGYRKESVNAAAKTAEVESFIGSFWGNQSLEEYLAQRFPGLSFADPNAFLVTEFTSFDSRYQKARPYPVEISCYKAVDFRYTNNVLDYLIVKEDTTYITSNGTLEKGEMYVMYLGNEIIKATQVEAAAYDITPDNEQRPVELGDFYSPTPSKRFKIETFQPRAKKVQAMRVGYIFDLQTDGRTFVSPLDNAIPYFLKAVKSISELDLTHALHAFPQKLFYAEGCPGERINLPAQAGRPMQTALSPCSAGISTKTGKTCGTCSGAGVVVHKSAQDALPVKMPKQGEQVTIKLEDMIAYKAPSVELLKVLHEYVKDLESSAIKAVFNSEILERTSGEPGTATGRVIDQDQLNNTLDPFAKQREAVWKFFVDMIAVLTDNDEDLYTVYEHPADFVIKGLDRLFADRKAAVDAGLPYHMIQALDLEIAGKMFAENERSLMRFKVRQRYTTFLGMSETFVTFLMSTGRTRRIDEVLLSHGDVIFDELETEVPAIYSLTPEKQWSYIKPKVDIIIKELEASAGLMGVTLDGGTDSEQLPDADAEGKARLRTSVGASSIVRQARLDIAEGISSREDAVNQLVVQLGYSKEDAELLIGSASQIRKEAEEQGTV